MKSKDNNLEKNISRLVKLAGDSNKPTKAFTDSLTDNALGELKKAGSGHKRERKDKTMKVSWKRTLSWAAMIMIVCGLGFGIWASHLSKTDEAIGPITQLTDKSSITKQAVKDYKAPQPAKIEYTQADDKIAAVSTSKSVEHPTIQSEIKLVAKADVKDKSTAPLMGDLRKGRRIDTERMMLERPMTAGKPVAGVVVSEKVRLGYQFSPEPCPRPYPMAHGGTVPPNGEDVDAMFFKNYGVNPFVDTEDDHLSTFATDVDTGSYTIVRGYLHDGHLPPEKAVRVEEFVNYFKYHYRPPQEDDFAVYAEAVPWKFGTGRKNSHLLRLGLKAKQISQESRKPAVLTFVIDVSGSMNRENRLGLVKKSLRMLVEKLKSHDRVGIAVYGSRGRKVMDHKGLEEKGQVLAAIESLCAGGSTYAEEGIRIGYEMAENAYTKGCINRVILCSDGVANVGKTGVDGILEVIKKKAEKGITLSAIGFGMGNYNDVLLERLGDKGNGHYAYIDTIAEAKRIFEDNLTGTLQMVARDVKVQVDFNPDVVRSYRLIGYENRDVPDEKFRDDKYDGGEIGAGHSVTALYELKLWPEKTGTAATTYVRYKHAETEAVTEFKSSIAVKDFNKSLDSSSSDFKLAATVAEFAEILRKSYWAKGAKLETVLEQAQHLNEEFKNNPDVIELVDLISKAKRLMKKPDVESAESEETVEVFEEP